MSLSPKWKPYCEICKVAHWPEEAHQVRFADLPRLTSADLDKENEEERKDEEEEKDGRYR